MKTITELVYPKVEQAMKDNKNVVKLNRVVSTYVDRNNQNLMSQGPSGRPMFGPQDEAPIYEMTKHDPKQIRQWIKENKYIKSQWQIMNNPFNTIMAMIIRYGVIAKNDKVKGSGLLYIALSMYPSLHSKYFQYPPNENVMAYTISNLSYKYKIRKTGNLLFAIIETLETCLELHEKDLVKGTDKGLVDFIMDIKSRLNSMMRNISNEFYNNHREGKYLNTEGDSTEEDNYYEADNNSYAVARLSEAVSLKLTTRSIDGHLVTLSAKMCKVSVNELRNYIIKLTDKRNTSDIHSLIESIISSYLVTEGLAAREIKDNKKFLNHSMLLYRKSNTSDPDVIEIKRILDKWMEEIDIYKKTQRLATINDFRKAIYLYFVLSISKLV